MDSFLLRWRERRSNQFSLISQKITTNLPTSIDPSELTARIQKAAPKYILVHRCPSRKEPHSPPRDETRYAQSRGDLVFPAFTLCPTPQPRHDGDVTETDLLSSTMATEAAQSLRDFPGASRRDGAQPLGRRWQRLRDRNQTCAEHNA